MDKNASRAPEAVIASLLEQIAAGKSVTKVCEQEGMPTIAQVYYWRSVDPAFKARLVQAQEAHADSLMDQIVPIADDATDPQKARNQIDARIKRAGSIKPKEYGPRVDLNVTTQVDYSAAHADAKERLRLMRDQPQTLIEQVIDGVVVFAPRTTDNESDDGSSGAPPAPGPSIFD